MRILLTLGLSLLLAACEAREEATTQPTLESLRGQWVVINYWAQWCKPCIEEIPELNALNDRYDEVTVLGVNYDGASGAELEQQLQTLNIKFFNLASDPSASLGVPRPVVLPSTLIVNPDGELLTTLVGPQTLESLALITGQMDTQQEQ
ncbi:MAG: TlpA disulfide reductase family protein [Halioglobus sp.]|nr:TlpA disulfide reductase family protein [Halioglobus sp.]